MLANLFKAVSRRLKALLIHWSMSCMDGPEEEFGGVSLWLYAQS